MSNVETYLAYLAGEYTGELPTPRAIRRELYLAKMCGMDVGTLPEPISQSDIYLKNLAENGTGGGADLPALVNAALAGDILAGKEAIDGSGEKLTGTMPDNGTVTQKLTTNVTEYTIPAGKHSGAGKVSVETEEKTITPTTEAQEVTPAEGKLLSKVTVEAAPASEDFVITSARSLFNGGARMDIANILISHLDPAGVDATMLFSGSTTVEEIDFTQFQPSKFTNFPEAFRSCSKLKRVNLSNVDFSDCTNFFCWCEYSYNLEEIIGLSAPNYQSNLAIYSGEKYKLKRLTFRTDLPDGTLAFTRNIALTNGWFERAGLVEMFTTLPDLSNTSYSGKTITLTGNPGVTGTNKAGETVPTLSAEDRLLATQKGWTLVE